VRYSALNSLFVHAVWGAIAFRFCEADVLTYERSLLCWIPSLERISEMARSAITLNMMLDQVIQIVDSSKWMIVDAAES
jgi:hypothetical protein